MSRLRVVEDVDVEKGSEKVLGSVLGEGSQKGSEKGACYGFSEEHQGLSRALLGWKPLTSTLLSLTSTLVFRSGGSPFQGSEKAHRTLAHKTLSGHPGGPGNGLRVKTQRVETSENFSEESNLPRRFRRYPEKKL